MCTAAIMRKALPVSCGMKVVKVYGALRKKLGQCRFEFEADTPAQALKALCVNFPDLQKWFLDNERNGIGFRVTIGREKITQECAAHLVLPWSEREVFSITPVITGAGQGAGMILAGIGLVAFAVLTAGLGTGFLGAGLGATSSFFVLGSTASTAIGSIGAALILGGIAQAISPTDPGSFERGREAARLESFSFSGIVNTAKQGLPVPIVYGRAYVGSAVISSGLDTVQLK